MYTDQFKTKESLTYYAFDILKRYANIYGLKYDESKEKLILHLKDSSKISIQVIKRIRNCWRLCRDWM